MSSELAIYIVFNSTSSLSERKGEKKKKRRSGGGGGDGWWRTGPERGRGTGSLTAPRPRPRKRGGRRRGAERSEAASPMQMPRALRPVRRRGRGERARSPRGQLRVPGRPRGRSGPGPELGAAPRGIPRTGPGVAPLLSAGPGPPAAPGGLCPGGHRALPARPGLASWARRRAEGSARCVAVCAEQAPCGGDRANPVRARAPAARSSPSEPLWELSESEKCEGLRCRSSAGMLCAALWEL